MSDAHLMPTPLCQCHQCITKPRSETLTTLHRRTGKKDESFRLAEPISLETGTIPITITHMPKHHIGNQENETTTLPPLPRHLHPSACSPCLRSLPWGPHWEGVTRAVPASAPAAAAAPPHPLDCSGPPDSAAGGQTACAATGVNKSVGAQFISRCIDLNLIIYIYMVTLILSTDAIFTLSALQANEVAQYSNDGSSTGPVLHNTGDSGDMSANGLRKLSYKSLELGIRGWLLGSVCLSVMVMSYHQSINTTRIQSQSVTSLSQKEFGISTKSEFAT